MKIIQMSESTANWLFPLLWIVCIPTILNIQYVHQNKILKRLCIQFKCMWIYCLYTVCLSFKLLLYSIIYIQMGTSMWLYTIMIYNPTFLSPRSRTFQSSPTQGFFLILSQFSHVCFPHLYLNLPPDSIWLLCGNIYC